MPECFFDANGTFTLTQCKLWGFSLTDWRTITGLSLTTIGTILLFIYRRAIAPPFRFVFQRMKDAAFAARVRSFRGGNLSILITRLEGDNPSNGLRESIVELITSELHHSVETIRWNEAISLPEGHGYDADVSAIKRLQALLKKTKCDLAIWGRVKSNDAISLRFTIAEGASRLPETYKLTDTLELPAGFVQALGLAIAIRLSTVEAHTRVGNFSTSFLRDVNRPWFAGGPNS